ncbi:putative non-heme bromoperoxidase BpoC [Actinomadura rubteroloni]|uniref:Putative non-heme bromoperoxidase BpoC n=1 Tax=Actinomadura rubteroloni TaxID=1926885 RepID=A0A2P4UIW8_9ACTN|nr:alpha/beta hydrolase [Actinomadura rubteroloni]POM24971.1 putative non-heme bromoperoxidase BpoC [Actinomadura rubteroloni]
MPVVSINGVRVGYEVHGASGPVVLLVTGTGAPGRVWRTHQVPALLAAGYRAVTMDNRGIPPSDTGGDFTLADMAADTAGLIEHLDAAPCRVVGFSLGAMIVQELLVARPDLAERAVLMATRGRSDPLAAAVTAAEIELCDSGVQIPARFNAVIRALQNLAPSTLADDDRVRDWLDILEMSAPDLTAIRGQLGVDLIPDRRPAYAGIGCPCLVLGFADDLVARPGLGREVAAAIPGARYEEIAGCGHYGYLERPDAVNAALLRFLGAPADRSAVVTRAGA